MDYPDSYYSRSALRPQARAPLKGAVECEVCVVGGGMAGIATALGLVERGRDVVLIEANRMAWGASGRNGGVLDVGYAAGHRGLVSLVGEAQARDLNDLCVDALALIENRIDRYAIDCGPVSRGRLNCSWFDNDKERREESDWLNRTFGLERPFWNRDQIAELYSTKRYHHGIFSANSIQLHSLNLAEGLAQAAEGHGARIFEGTRCSDVSEKDNKKILFCGKGRVIADQVVFCLSGYNDGLQRQLAAATLKVATYVLLTEPIEEDRLREAVRTHYATSDNRFFSDYYRLLPDRRLLWGGRVSSNKDPRGLAKTMLRDILFVYPQLSGALSPAVAWPGTMGYARHRMPQIGKLAEGLWYCQGFGGAGMVTTTVGGEAIAAAISGEDERIQLFEPFGLQYTGGVFGPWLAQGLYAWWRFRDWLRR